MLRFLLGLGVSDAVIEGSRDCRYGRLTELTDPSWLIILSCSSDELGGTGELEDTP